MTLDEAHLQLLDHAGENVHVGIMLPGSVPWAGGPGVLRHQAQRLIDDTSGREWALRLIQASDWSGKFMVGEFVIPLDAERVTAVRRKEGGEHPGLDFTVGTDHTVRLTFVEHSRDPVET